MQFLDGFWVALVKEDTEDPSLQVPKCSLATCADTGVPRRLLPSAPGISLQPGGY